MTETSTTPSGGQPYAHAASDDGALIRSATPTQRTIWWPAYVAPQMGHKNAKMLFTVYAKWIDGADRGREKAKMEAMLGEKDSPAGGEISHKSPRVF
ncbi:hypothetical protein M5C97_08440 [Acidovorax sp. NCPPB 3859]|nr:MULTISPECIES: hypothetical protein [unclassified Acidovorax]MDA8452856.1 hypothetical protein [Acidovorax sp. GBBC 3297]MDA8462234.1 hypothetical protein [Acidovorax sp. GBBC 3333]MDA8467298.1 hypothetical protein [Acidovorax sp. GBBC 3332]MDA8472303.1 hypothetical protein [Acidovorax sp. GBBC 3299]WCM80298.1 hypothetical protein M5C94_08435 [Acidovorax sp. GBBC 712]